MGTTWQELTRIVAAKGCQPDTIIAGNIYPTTKPEQIEVLLEDGIMYITEKR